MPARVSSSSTPGGTQEIELGFGLTRVPQLCRHHSCGCLKKCFQAVLLAVNTSFALGLSCPAPAGEAEQGFGSEVPLPRCLKMRNAHTVLRLLKQARMPGPHNSGAEAYFESQKRSHNLKVSKLPLIVPARDSERLARRNPGTRRRARRCGLSELKDKKQRQTTRQQYLEVHGVR